MPKYVPLQTPREQIADLEILIQHEKDLQKSLRISTNPEYYANQKAYIESQLVEWTKRLEILTENFEQGEAKVKASQTRLAEYQKKILRLKHHKKLEKLREVEATILKLMEGIG